MEVIWIGLEEGFETPGSLLNLVSFDGILWRWIGDSWKFTESRFSSSPDWNKKSNQDRNLSVILFFEYSTVRGLVRHLTANNVMKMQHQGHL